VSVAARVSAFAALALLGGVGTVYAPVLTFTAVAVLFALGLWTLAGSRQPSLARPKVSGGDKPKPRDTQVTRLVSGYLLVFWAWAYRPARRLLPAGGDERRRVPGVAGQPGVDLHLRARRGPVLARCYQALR
jgi:hypothetical protein